MNAVATPLMTTEEMLALPDDGTERWLIHGELHDSRRRALPSSFHGTLYTIGFQGENRLSGERNGFTETNPDIRNTPKSP